METGIIQTRVANWSAVLSLSLSVVGLITAELLPISLLTPVASSLNVSESAAGQAVTATAVVAMVASLFMASVTRSMDRRSVMLTLSILFVASNIIAGMSDSYSMLILGRVLLGVSLGGFWSMCAAVTIRLVPKDKVPQALGMIFGGASLAMALVAPLGTWLGGIFGWRDIFFATAIAGCINVIWQFIVLPAMAPASQSKISTLFSLLTRSNVSIGMLAMMLVFGGHFVFFTYLRSFLENKAGFHVNTISLVLLGFGVANVIGNSLAGRLINYSLLVALFLPPLFMVLLAGGLYFITHQTMIVSVLVSLWGFAMGAVPVAWTTWLTRVVPDETESGGGLQVAAIQLAITTGAAVGGALYTAKGSEGLLHGSGIILVLAVILIFTGMRSKTWA